MPVRKLTVNDVAPTPVKLERAFVPRTSDQILWVVIRNSADALSFDNYRNFIEPIMCGGPPIGDGHAGAVMQQNGQVADAANLMRQRGLPFPDIEPYRLLKVATEVFMMANCGCLLDQRGDRSSAIDRTLRSLSGNDLSAEARRLGYPISDSGALADMWDSYLRPTRDIIPYLWEIVRIKLGDVPIRDDHYLGLASDCYGILRAKLTRPCLLELLWNYWLEEGMLAQTMNAITWRFQNRRGPGEHDPLALLEIDPLRPLNNLLWGWIQDEQHRLTIARRAYEYDHEYGLRLLGKAVPDIRAADSRSRFLEGLHNLLNLCATFYKEDDDTTVVADGFPILNALREVHLTITQGAHNQYGDLPWTARHEFLMMEWILSRPEMREFLPGRVMVDYPEPWMDRVEAMNTVQGWTDTSILHFRDLGIFGEKILLSIRYGLWTNEIEAETAANWARYWRPEIQGYIHAYRTVTGVDLSSQVVATVPAVLLRDRLLTRYRQGLPPEPRQALPQESRRALPQEPRRALPEASRQAPQQTQRQAQQFPR